MTTNDLIDYYKSLLILQYRSLANAPAHVAAWVSEFVQDQIVAKVRDGFDVLTAIGSQLDLLGVYRGVRRIVFGVTAADYWSLVPADDVDPDSYFGWALAAGADPTWGWLQIQDLTGVTYQLTDSQMRLMIQLRAQFQAWDGTLASLDGILYDFFGTYVNVVDNKDMTMEYSHQSADPDPNQLWAMVVLAGILPHNAGVGVTIVEV